MNANDIRSALVYQQGVYLHYTTAEGLSSILQEGVIRPNFKGVVYLSQEPVDQRSAHNTLFIGATTHAGRGSHLLVLALDTGLPVTRLTDYEFSVSQNIKLHQHTVLFAGANPF